MTGRLQDKIAIITGAASGIGRATVRRFLDEGAWVLAADIKPGPLAELETAVGQKQAQRLIPLTGDVTRRADTEAIVQQAIKRFDKLDILVNSAGITPRTIPDADFEARWERVIEVNVKGTLLMSHAAVEVMRHNGGGAIVNIASVMGLVGYPTTLPFSDGFNAYPHSKGAVVQMTRDMGVRLAQEGIRVNAVCPGFIYTALTENVTNDPDIHATLRQLHPMGRLGEADEVATVIAFLASDEASFVAAATWPVDGGYTAA